MRIKEWLMAQKKKRLARRQEKARRKLEEVTEELHMLGEDPTVQRSEAGETELPKSRFTEEYKEFLKAEEARKQTENRIEES